MPSPKAAPLRAGASAVRDRRSCERWLRQTPLTDPREACFELTTLLEEIEEAPPSPRQYLDILETLRRPVFVAQEENTRRFAARSLPLSGTETSAFDQVFDLWTTYGRAYRRLAFEIRDDLDSGHPARPRLPLLIARGLEALSELMVVHYRARREIDGELWHDLHQLYAAAEATGVEFRPSEDPGSVSPPPFEHYVRQLLLHLASPYALTSRDLGWVRRWTRNWARKAAFTDPAEGQEILGVDVLGSEPGHRVRKSMGRNWRYLDLREIRRSVRWRLQSLADGITPEQLGLGSDCDPGEATHLLSLLDHHWFETTPRTFRRRAVTGRCEVAATFTDIHRAIGGRVNRGPERLWDYTRRDTEQLYVYGFIPTDADDPDGFVAERWEMMDDSATGFRVRRRGAGERLDHLQLIGLKPPGAPRFILCEVRWLVQGNDGSLTCGIQAMPGLAQAISAQSPTGEAGRAEKISAFLLPGTQDVAPSLVLPVRTFRENRQLDLGLEGRGRRVELTSLLDQGIDYERVTFAIVA